jgi:hypothetical protein
VSDVTRDSKTMMDQASMTACYWMDRIVADVDASFGEGFSKEHPNLIGVLVQAAAIDELSGSVRIAGQDIRDALANLPVFDGSAIEESINALARNVTEIEEDPWS